VVVAKSDIRHRVASKEGSEAEGEEGEKALLRRIQRFFGL